MTVLEVRNLKPALIASYLREELDGDGDDEGVAGEGWRVHLRVGEPAGVGGIIATGHCAVLVQGDAEEPGAAPGSGAVSFIAASAFDLRDELKSVSPCAHVEAGFFAEFTDGGVERLFSIEGEW